MNILKNRFFFISLVLILSLLLLLSTLFSLANLDVEAIRLSEMDFCFKDGQIPCRWVADLGRLFGYPLFNYYAPLPYYFGELIYAITSDLIISTKIIFAVSFTGSFIFMFLLLRKFFGKWGVAVCAFAYTLVPYYILNFYTMGTVDRLWGLMFFPAVFWKFAKLQEKVDIRNLLQSAIFLAALILSHKLSATIFLPVILGWIIFLFLKRKVKMFLMFSGGSIILAVILASFYFLPMIFEKNLVRFDFLPIYAKEPPKNLAIEKYKILTGNTEVLNFAQGSNWFSFKADTKTHTIIRLSQHYFPDWKIFVDGKETKIDYKSNNLGLMTIILGQGKHAIYGKLYDTPIRTVSNILSVLGSVIVLILYLVSFKETRKWLSYYKKGIS